MAEDPRQDVTRRFEGEDKPPASRPDLTRHYSEPVAPKEAVTKLYAPQESSNTLLPATLVADRYRVDRRLSGAGGEAEVYLAKDEVTSEVVVLKVYRPQISPKISVLQAIRALPHPNVVTIKDFGDFGGRFYEVMEYCDGGNLMKLMPYSEVRVKKFLPYIIAGIKHLHDQGIIHRDIKPSNIFFRDSVSGEVVLGDFGISSQLDDGQKGRLTQTADFLTVDYSAPEFLSKGLAQPAMDYYALGITVIHLVLGKSPFAGLTVQATLYKHFQNDIPLPTKTTQTFLNLVNGLTAFAPVERWGYEQVSKWLKGESVPAPRKPAMMNRQRPYPGCPAARSPSELGHLLHSFEAEKDLFRGRISAWVREFDSYLADRIKEIEETLKDTPEIGLVKLRFLLNPDDPLEFGGTPVTSLKDLIHLLSGIVAKTNLDQEATDQLMDALYDATLECWLDATLTGQRTSELVGKMAEIRRTVADRRVGLLALLYTLTPSFPFHLTPDLYVKAPEEFAPILRGDPRIKPRLARLVATGAVDAWLSRAFPDSPGKAAYFTNLRKTYQDRLDLLEMALQWHFLPETPLPFGKESATTPKVLAALIDRDEASRNIGKELIQQGVFTLWLESTGRLVDTDRLKVILAQERVSLERKLELVLGILDPTLPPPQMEATPITLDFGRLRQGEIKTKVVQVQNNGRGFLSGSAFLQGTGRGFSVQPREFEGTSTDLTVKVNTEGLPFGSRHRSELSLDSNGGNMVVALNFEVAAPWSRIVRNGAIHGLILGGMLALFRGALGATPWFHEVSNRRFTVGDLTGYSAILLVFLVWFLAIFAAWMYYMLRLSRQNEPHHEQRPTKPTRTGSPQELPKPGNGGDPPAVKTETGPPGGAI